MREQIAAAAREALEAAASERGFTVDEAFPLEVERPRDRSHGDWSTNAALVAAKAAGMPPRELSELMVKHLPAIDHVAAVEIAGPGFINFTLSTSWLHEVLTQAATDDGYGRSTLGAGTRVQVEFVSANPNGPLHIGHGRNGVLGDSLAGLLEFAGFEVEREYYFNDAGVQIDLYAESLEARYRQALGQVASVPEAGYWGAYLEQWGRELADQAGDSLADGTDGSRRQIRSWGLDRAMADIRETLDEARIGMDTWKNEAELHEAESIAVALNDLHARGYTYKEGGATWLRSTEMGDEKDRVLVKSDGTTTYLAPDIAYHREKLERGFDVLINIWGADHHGYVDRVHAGLASLGYDPDRLEIVITQLVNVLRGGEPVQMSTRRGDFITFREVLDEVGRDATRYFLVAFSPDTTINFDLETAAAQSMDNPVYYLQYAHARMVSLERFASEQGVTRLPLTEVDLSVLAHPAELEVLRQIDRLPEEVEEAARRRAPHRLCAYGADFATAFHKFYNDCRIIGEDPGVTQARLWLVAAARTALVAVLSILGLSAPEKM